MPGFTIRISVRWGVGECGEKKMPVKDPRKEGQAGEKQEAAAEVEGIR